MNQAVCHARLVTRNEVEPWLPQLDEWLLDGTLFSVQHTWPQLYRQDQEGMFFVVTDGDRLLSHCAGRIVTAVDERGEHPIGLIGSVATNPDARGLGHATQALAQAVATMAPQTDYLLLWAEQPQLYARAGFVDTASETGLMLARRPIPQPSGWVRPATAKDHAAMHALHERKPSRVKRSLATMTTLLATPGMDTLVLEDDGQVVAYACCGKGADLQGHWHEVGGSDQDVARLLPAAMHALGQRHAILLLPPYRGELRERLDAQVISTMAFGGPMTRTGGGNAPSGWIDGLDSV